MQSVAMHPAPNHFTVFRVNKSTSLRGWGGTEELSLLRAWTKKLANNKGGRYRPLTHLSAPVAKDVRSVLPPAPVLARTRQGHTQQPLAGKEEQCKKWRLIESGPMKNAPNSN